MLQTRCTSPEGYIATGIISAPEVFASIYSYATRLMPYVTTATITAGKYGPDAIAFAAGALGYDGDIPGAKGDEIAKGLRLGAAKFYARFDKYLSRGANYIASHLRGIDFSRDVTVVVLEKGTQVVQYIDKETGKVGDYFAPIGVDPSTLGIDTKNRVARVFTLDKDVTVLKSTAADYCKDGVTYSGGGIQYFSPEVKVSSY